VNARLVIAIEPQRLQVTIRAQEYRISRVWGIDYDPHQQVAVQLHRVETPRLQPDVFIVAVEAFNA
jgi:hypothetical protein